MAKFKVLKPSKDKKTKEVFETGTIVDKPVKYINDHEKKLEDLGYTLPFFERLDK